MESEKAQRTFEIMIDPDKYKNLNCRRAAQIACITFYAQII